MSEIKPPDTKRADLWFKIILASVVVLELSVALLDFHLHKYWDAVTFVMFACTFGSFFWHRKLWVAIGYRRGRFQAYEAIREAEMRGMTPNEWYLAEIERSLGVAIQRGLGDI